MSKDNSGTRVVSSDGSRSYFFERSSSGFGRGKLSEISYHRGDGTTDSYEYDPSITGELFGGRGKKKN